MIALFAGLLLAAPVLGSPAVDVRIRDTVLPIVVTDGTTSRSPIGNATIAFDPAFAGARTNLFSVIDATCRTGEGTK